MKKPLNSVGVKRLGGPIYTSLDCAQGRTWAHKTFRNRNSSLLLLKGPWGHRKTLLYYQNLTNIHTDRAIDSHTHIHTQTHTHTHTHTQTYTHPCTHHNKDTKTHWDTHKAWVSIHCLFIFLNFDFSKLFLMWNHYNDVHKKKEWKYCYYHIKHCLILF